MSFLDDMRDAVGTRVAFVLEVHDKWPCSNCGGRGWHRCLWLNVVWVSGADPPGRPVFVLCAQCWESSEIGQLVG